MSNRLKWLRKWIANWVAHDPAIHDMVLFCAEAKNKSVQALEIMKDLRGLITANADVELNALRAKGNATIVVATKLNGGRIKVFHAQFRDGLELSSILDEFEKRFAATLEVIDAPRGFGDYLWDVRRSRREL